MLARHGIYGKEDDNITTNITTNSSFKAKMIFCRDRKDDVTE